MAVTQQQIAEQANVSRSTVAAVMSESQRDRISPEVRERVLNTAKKLGYRPNRHAQVMRGVRSNCIGILSFSSTSSLIHRKLKATTQAIESFNYRFIVEELLWYNSLGPEALTKAIDNFIDARVEGVVLNYPSRRITQSMLNRFLDARIPVVSIGETSLQGLTHFLSDRRWGYQTITEHLLKGGYRRLVLLATLNSYGYDGFSDALKKYPLARKHSSIQTIDIPRNKLDNHPIETHSHIAGMVAMEEVLKRNLNPDAVVCTNDEWAIGAMTACAQAGLRIPEDIAITGFDNDPASGFGVVPITTIDHPIQEISARAVSALMDMIQKDHLLETRDITIKGKLLVRQSCGLAHLQY